MEQKDYLMRQIEQAGKFLRKLFLLMSGRNDEEVESETQTDFYSELMDFLQFNAGDFIELDEQEILERIKAVPGFNLTNIELLADILVLYVKNEEPASTEQQRKLRNIAWALYEFADRQGKTFDQSRTDKMNQLKNFL
jgi:hypothetical protein